MKTKNDAPPTLSKTFFENNRTRFLQELADNSIAVFFAGEPPFKTGDEYYAFAPCRNLLYITGVDAPKVIYFAQKRGGEIEETFFIERFDAQKARWVGRPLDADGVTEKSGVQSVKYLDEFDEAVAKAVLSGAQTIYMNCGNFCADYRQSAALTYYRKFAKNYPTVQLADGGKIIERMRAIKTDDEILQIKRAIDITRLAFEHIINTMTTNMYEYQIESCFDFALKYNGVKERAFDTIIASGKNATILHYNKNDARLPENGLVLLDFGASWNYYSADISRTLPVSGKFTERQKQLYDVVLEAQQAIIAEVKPGVTIAELKGVLRDCYKKSLKEAGLINKKLRGSSQKAQIERLCPHRMGHALGLNTHDCAPKTEDILVPGMVITVEPGLYVDMEEIGIRIEDDILVTENGCVNLSEKIPKTTEAIEALFAALKK